MLKLNHLHGQWGQIGCQVTDDPSFIAVEEPGKRSVPPGGSHGVSNYRKNQYPSHCVHARVA